MPTDQGTGITLPWPLRVLLVEDSEADAALIRAYLSRPKGGFEIVHVTSQRAAQAELAHGPWHLVLLDLGLPDSQGTEGVSMFEGAAPSMGIVVLSDSSLEQSGVSAIARGADDYLEKRFMDRETLLLTVGTVVGHRLHRGGARARAAEDPSSGAASELTLLRLLNCLDPGPADEWAVLVLGFPGPWRQHVFQAMTHHLGDRALSFRLGRDRAVVLFRCTDRDSALPVATELFTAVRSASPRIGGAEVDLRAGLTTLSRHPGGSALLKAADRELQGTTAKSVATF